MISNSMFWESRQWQSGNYQLTGTLKLETSVTITREAYSSEMIDIAKMEITRSIWSQFYGDIMNRLNILEHMAYRVPVEPDGRHMVEEIRELRALIAAMK